MKYGDVPQCTTLTHLFLYFAKEEKEEEKGDRPLFWDYPF